MHIVCPNCKASYQVSASAIGAAGRPVRCVRCRIVWHQSPQAEPPPLATVPSRTGATRKPASDATVAAFKSELSPPPAAAAEPAPIVSENGDPAGPSLDQLIGTPAADEAAAPDAEPGQPDAAALSEIAIPIAAAPPIAPETSEVASDSSSPRAANIESIAARRRGKRGNARRRMSARSARMPAAILMLACMVAALIAWRGSIVRHAPQMASLYAALGLPVNLRGLTFTDVKVSRDIHDGVAVLVVEGAIASAASKPVEVPRLRFAMRNDAGSEVYAWTAMPTREVLEPGETLPFRSRLASPPGEGRDVTVRFFTRLDATAGLR